MPKTSPCRSRSTAGAGQAGPDTGVDTFHKVEGPGRLGGPEGPRSPRDNRRKREKRERKGEKEEKRGEKKRGEREKKENQVSWYE